MAPEVVPPHVVERVATEVAHRAEVRGLFVVDTHLVLTQFGHSPKGLVAHFTLVSADSRVKRLVFFQAVAPAGGERTVFAPVRPGTFVFECNMLCHAPFLLTAESTEQAMQRFRLSGIELLLFMNVQNVVGCAFVGFCAFSLFRAVR